MVSKPWFVIGVIKDMPTKNKTNRQLFCEVDGEIKPLGKSVEIKTKIKPCPFCGEKAKTFHIPENNEEEVKQHLNWKWNYPGMWVIGCDTEMCMGNINHFTMIFIDEESAVETWNRRVCKCRKEKLN